MRCGVDLPGWVVGGWSALGRPLRLYTSLFHIRHASREMAVFFTVIGDAPSGNYKPGFNRTARAWLQFTQWQCSMEFQRCERDLSHNH